MTRRWSGLTVGCAFAAVLVLGQTAHGQSPGEGSVLGVLRTTAGDPVPNALVTLREPETGLEWPLRTDFEGVYRYELVIPGWYELRFEKLGFGPLLIAPVRVRPGLELRVDGTVRVLERPATTIDSLRWRGGALSAGSAGDWIPSWTTSELPHAGRDAWELGRLSSRADRMLGLEGLPPWLVSLAVDGQPFRPVAHPQLRQLPLGGTSFGLGGAATAEVLTSAADVEWGGAAGGWLSLHSQRGTPSVELTGRGAWTGSALPGPSFGNGLAWNDAQGGLLLRARAAGGEASVAAGVEMEHRELPVSRRWGDTPGAEALAGLGDSFGVDFASYRRSAVAQVQSVSGFARADWAFSERHRLGGTVQFATAPKLIGLEPRLGTPTSVEGTDLLVAGSLMVRANAFDIPLLNDARVSLSLSSRSSAGVAVAGPTWLVSDGLGLGGLTSPASGDEARLRIGNTLHLGGRRHHVKVGLGADVASHRYDYRLGSEGEYYFGSLDDLIERRGLAVRSLGPAYASDWRTFSPFAFVQNRWQAAAGLEILIGGRVTRSGLPSDGVARDNEWFQLSGLANDAAGRQRLRYDVRGGITWDVTRGGGAVLFASGGTFTDEIDPLLLHEWRADAGTGRVRREFGTVSWPSDPATGGTFRRVTMLATDFAPPRTHRGTAGVSLRLGDHTTALLSGTVRRTENLPRRTDLNLIPAPSQHDQYGRPVFGTLEQRGALLFAVPGTGRRFIGYDEAAGINADGRSDYWGFDAGVEHETPQGLGLLARYTFSSTEDNWFGGREGGWTSAAPRGLDGAAAWADGTSDFDRPHRIAAAAIVPLPLHARLSAVYRGESGLPFTPGFREGVDADGDGHFGNDPAFIDPSFEGMSETVARWSCLAASRGTFAARNSCRGPASHTLDLGLAIDVLRRGARRATLNVEAFDIFESAPAVPDAALFLVDPAGALHGGDGAGTVTVPLVLNPGFGSQIHRPHAGRTLRLGVSVKW